MKNGPVRLSQDPKVRQRHWASVLACELRGQKTIMFNDTPVSPLPSFSQMEGLSPLDHSANNIMKGKFSFPSSGNCNLNPKNLVLAGWLGLFFVIILRESFLQPGLLQSCGTMTATRLGFFGGRYGLR